MDSLLTAIEGTCTRVENFTISSLRRHVERNEMYVAPLETDIRRTKRELIDAQDMVKKVCLLRRKSQLSVDNPSFLHDWRAAFSTLNLQSLKLESGSH